jgi:hypothetical protein
MRFTRGNVRGRLLEEAAHAADDFGGAPIILWNIADQIFELISGRVDLSSASAASAFTCIDILLLIEIRLGKETSSYPLDQEV